MIFLQPDAAGHVAYLSLLNSMVDSTFHYAPGRNGRRPEGKQPQAHFAQHLCEPRLLTRVNVRVGCSKKDDVPPSYAAPTIIWSGAVVGTFVIIPVLHLTVSSVLCLASISFSGQRQLFFPIADNYS